MSGNYDSEQWQNFNERLSLWISKQGFWFQLRHSLSNDGSKLNILSRMWHLALRLLLLGLIGFAAWAVMVKMTGEEKFVKQVEQVFQERFAADDVELRGVNRQQGRFGIARMVLFSDKGSFFRAIEMSNLLCKRDFFVDFGKNWEPGIIEISKVSMSIRAGTDTEEAAREMGDVLFQSFGDLKVDAIHVSDMSIRWGYTERSRGAIQNSKMKAVPTTDGWRLSFRGGDFTQNWLRNLQIEELDVVINRQGMRFDKAVFSRNRGSMILNDFKLESGQRPKVSGVMRLKGMEITPMLPVVARSYVDGRISGEFDVKGSTNTSDGIGFDGIVTLDEGDVISLRDSIPLLKALSVVDAFNVYRRVDFTSGSFGMKFLSEGVQFSNFKLFAEDLMGLTGNMLVRKPHEDEELAVSDDAELLRAVRKGEEWTDHQNKSLTNTQEIAELSQSDEQIESDQSLFNKLSILRQARRMKETESEILTRSYRYEGAFQVSLMNKVFERAPKLAEKYPPAQDTGRIYIHVPIKGLLYELTNHVSKEIYEKGGK